MKKLLLVTIALIFAVSLFAQDKVKKERMKSASISAGQTTSDYYSWSNVTYTWTDISSTGTEVTLDGSDDDDYYGSFPIGFSFPFYDNTFTEFYFGTNGGIYFDDEELDYEYYELPTSYASDDGENYITSLIAWHWADLEMDDDDGTEVYYQTFPDYTIVQFVDYQDHDDTDYYGTAQVVLYKNGNIEIRYKSMDASYFDENFVVGVQKDGTEGLEVAYDDAGFFNTLPKSILIVNKANAEPVPFSIYSVFALFALIGGVTVFKLRKRIFNIV
ncbi:hypothetical protein [uncultured Draconibacterium sp.]|uniref:hypothetical protein n=1 Tax=uncultured Draconibacterium sp. TaxID=1573823 RepID=UPI0025D3B613|nr:hypothetical protein [uncultured Draconibacterium sp.]